ncbi:MAG: 4Fe-4S binding protein [Promethearchaeia archaeon]
MTIINVTVPFRLIKEIKDYSEIINTILEHDVSFNILKFSLGSNGVSLLLDVPEEKIKTITESLEKNEVIVNQKGQVIIDFELCTHCGGCISLCPTDALHFDEEDKLNYSEGKCISCLLCLDSCPRNAIDES